MKIAILCCLTLSLVCVCFGQLQTNNPIINRPILRLMNRGVNNIAPVRPVGPVIPPRRFIQFLPVPVVKKVTHHHVHHVIAHKGVVKSKYASDNGGLDFDNKDSDNDSKSNDNDSKSNDNALTFKTFKEETGLSSDLADNGHKSIFSKRGGKLLPNNSVATLADLIKSTGGGKSSIRGIIGGQKAEFLPIVIGILDDSQDSKSDNEFSKRKGVIRPDIKNRYLPPRETIKLFENLAKLGLKK